MLVNIGSDNDELDCSFILVHAYYCIVCQARLLIRHNTGLRASAWQICFSALNFALLLACRAKLK